MTHRNPMPDEKREEAGSPAAIPEPATTPRETMGDEITSPDAEGEDGDVARVASVPAAEITGETATPPRNDEIELSAGFGSSSESPIDPLPAIDAMVGETPSAVAAASLSQKIEIAPLPPAVATDRRIGRTLAGRYRLEKLIGKGGMGSVYRAIQFPLERSVAVKILNPDFQRKDPQFVRRFFLEAASAARLSHPNTITVFDYGEGEDGELFIAMEYLRGRALSQVLKSEGALSAERALHIGMQICRALREAHSKGMIHRDLKPGNILLLEETDDADFVKVLDFGLVKLFNAPKERADSLAEPLTPGPIVEADLTRAGMFLGSPKYMSPEQIQAHPLDTRTDIYSLGVLMYQMVAGKPPFTGATSVEIIYKHVNHAVPWIASVAPEVVLPGGFEEAIRKCLAKKREDRFDSMAALLATLKDVRRLMTGVSFASLSGIGFSQRSAESQAESPLATSTASESAASVRPQTRPITLGSIRALGGRVASREISFSDPVARAYLSQANASATPAASANRWISAAPWVAAGALVLSLGVLAYVFSARAPSATEPARGIDPAREPRAEVRATSRATRIHFGSEPAGARVSRDGSAVGVTPFSATFSRSDDGESGEFSFELLGYRNEVREIRFDRAAIAVDVRMRPDTMATDEATRPGNKESSDYKKNPY